MATASPRTQIVDSPAAVDPVVGSLLFERPKRCCGTSRVMAGSHPGLATGPHMPPMLIWAFSGRGGPHRVRHGALVGRVGDGHEWSPSRRRTTRRRRVGEATTS